MAKISKKNKIFINKKEQIIQQAIGAFNYGGWDNFIYACYAYNKLNGDI